MVIAMRINDNSYKAKVDFSDIATLTSRIADKTLEQLEREGIFVFPELINISEDITKEQMILRSVNDSFCTGNVMGFIGYGNQQLIIQSRFANNSDFFLQYMLSKVLDFPNLVDLQTNADQDNQMFNLLVFLFPRYLKAAMRKGPFKTYIRNRYNDDNLKGSIDVARHIKENTPFVGSIAYNQREFSYDNYLMELVRHTIEFIAKKPFGRSILAKVKDETKIVIEATSDFESHDKRKVLLDNQHNTIRHAYYREYKALQHLCILILHYQKHRVGDGTNKLYGILFDGSWLWEEYINTIIGEYYYHPENKSGLNAQRLFSGNNGKIFPDFISKNHSPRVIADAKYKPIQNINGDDYLQILAYMLRFDAKYGLFLYPEPVSSNCDVVLSLNEGVTFEENVKPRDDIKVVKMAFNIPKGSNSFSEFTAYMEQTETNLLLKLSKFSESTYGQASKLCHFAAKYLDSFSNHIISDSNLENDLGNDCADQGFIMDSGNGFTDKYSKEAFHKVDVLREIIGEVDSIDLLGSAIYSRWRAITHWEESSLLSDENRDWFVVAFNRLLELTKQ